MFWLKMAFGSNCGEKKLEFFHQKSALPMIFFQSPQKAHQLSNMLRLQKRNWKFERFNLMFAIQSIEVLSLIFAHLTH